MRNSTRNSNLELYRIIFMFLIVVHHYFVNSGLVTLAETDFNAKSVFLHFWGMWGHVGTNCFVLITGYYMCTSSITLKKYLKLFLEVETYNLILYFFFLVIGKEYFSLSHFIYIVMPVHRIETGFVECFLVFYLLIPFINILIRNLNRRLHAILILICIFIFSVFAKIPGFHVNSNYVEWFSVIYLIGSYIRKYPYKEEKTSFWLWNFILSVLVAWCSIIFFLYLRSRGGNYPGYTLLMAAQAPFALIISVCAFMLFKGLNIKQSRFINIVGGCTFGVLIIHANSEIMCEWLWHDVFRNTDFYSTSLIYLHAIIVPIIVFVVCSLIEYIRSRTIENVLIKLFHTKTECIVHVFSQLCSKK